MEFLRPPEPMNAGKEMLLCLNALQYFFCILLFLYTFLWFLLFVLLFVLFGPKNHLNVFKKNILPSNEALKNSHGVVWNSSLVLLF